MTVQREIDDPGAFSKGLANGCQHKRRPGSQNSGSVRIRGLSVTVYVSPDGRFSRARMPFASTTTRTSKL